LNTLNLPVIPAESGSGWTALFDTDQHRNADTGFQSRGLHKRTDHDPADHICARPSYPHT